MKESYNSIDIAKFICSIGIVALHVPPIDNTSILLPYINFVTSLCVPLFFIFSSYLFFNNTTEVNLDTLKRFLYRISILYSCWFFINLVINPTHTTLTNLIVNLVFGNTFPGSWFYSALIISTLIVYFLRNLNYIYMIFISLFVYIYITLNFSHLISGYIFNWYQNNIYIVFLSFPYALIWTTIGFLIKKNRNRYIIYFNIIFALSFVALYAIFKNNIYEIISWYVRLILCEIIGLLCINNNINLNLPYKTLRNISTLVFMIHFSFLYIIPDDFICNINLKFFIVSILSLLISIIIIKLSKLKYLTFLKQLY